MMDFVWGVSRGKRGRMQSGDCQSRNQVYFVITYEDDWPNKQIPQIIINEVVGLYGVLLYIISNRDPQFTSQL